MGMLEKVVGGLEESNPDALLADDIEDALVGIAVVHFHGERRHLAAYSMQKVIEVFMRDRDMSYEDAYELATVDTFSAYVGEHTPVYIDELREIHIPIDNGAHSVLAGDMYEI
jgi:hypothetical protein